MTKLPALTVPYLMVVGSKLRYLMVAGSKLRYLMVEVVVQAVLLAEGPHLGAGKEPVHLAQQGRLVDLPRNLLTEVDVVRVGLHHHRLEHGQRVLGVVGLLLCGRLDA
jgi:hypothetical protein